jgi:hypothetical protein
MIYRIETGETPEYRYWVIVDQATGDIVRTSNAYPKDTGWGHIQTAANDALDKLKESA